MSRKLFLLVDLIISSNPHQLAQNKIETFCSQISFTNTLRPADTSLERETLTQTLQVELQIDLFYKIKNNFPTNYRIFFGDFGTSNQSIFAFFSK